MLCNFGSLSMREGSAKLECFSGLFLSLKRVDSSPCLVIRDETNALAYFASALVTKKKSFVTLRPVRSKNCKSLWFLFGGQNIPNGCLCTQFYKTFFLVIDASENKLERLPMENIAT
jgi:hypothetical protein